MDFTLELGMTMAADYLSKQQFAEVERAFRTRPASMQVMIELGVPGGAYDEVMLAHLMLAAARQASALAQA